MFAIINGAEGGKLALFNGGNETIRAMLLSEADGSQLNITGGTVSLEFYDRADRRNASSKSLSCTLTTPTAGLATRAVVSADITLTKGATYYMFVKYVTSGALVEFSDTYTEVTIL